MAAKWSEVEPCPFGMVFSVMSDTVHFLSRFPFFSRRAISPVDPFSSREKLPREFKPRFRCYERIEEQGNDERSVSATGLYDFFER